MQDDKAGGGILYHEDIEVGTPLMLGGTTVTKDAIIAFAQAYDPQPIHLDEEAAKHSLVGGLCASGYHTCALMMRKASSTGNWSMAEEAGFGCSVSSLSSNFQANITAR